MNSVTRTILEGAILLIIAVGVGFGMNAIRQRDHIDLSRNYKPKIDPDAIRKLRDQQHSGRPDTRPDNQRGAVNGAGTANGTSSPDPDGDDVDGGHPQPPTAADPNAAADPVQTAFGGTPQVTPEEPTDEIPFKRLDFADVKALRDAPGFEFGSILIIDARNDDLYEAGHIPGAIQFDYYRYEQFIDAVVPLAMGAQHIAIYCHGGDCDDSLLTAQKLMDFGVSWEAIHVYEGGWEDWERHGAPVATGREG